MNSIEFDTKELRESLSNSLEQHINGLEKTLKLQGDLSEEEKQIQLLIKTEISRAVQEQGLQQKRRRKLDLEGLNEEKKYALRLATFISSIIKQYSNRLTEEIQQKLKKIEMFYQAGYSFFELVESFEKIKKCLELHNVFNFLKKLDKKMFFIAEEIEDNGKLLAENLPFYNEMTRNNLTILKQIIREKIDNNKNQLENDPKALKEIDRQIRLIDRTINSTLWYLDKYKQEIEEEKREKERLEKEQKSLESLKAWVEEDQLKDLTKEDIEEEDLVMKMMEEDRKKEQLAKNQKALELIKSWIERDETTTVTQEEREENDLLLEIIDANRERKLFSKE